MKEYYEPAKRESVIYCIIVMTPIPVKRKRAYDKEEEDIKNKN